MFSLTSLGCHVWIMHTICYQIGTFLELNYRILIFVT